MIDAVATPNTAIPKVGKTVTVSGGEDDDALHHQERAVRPAIEEARR